ncbi:Protein SZT2, partial [Stegodyphus mimosarum]
MLDINVWQKWMHAHRIGVILQHDMPLPNNLHLPNSSGRYVNVQCRQATAALNSLLSEHCSFVLVENHSYIKLLFDEADKPPTSFYVIRVTSKPPCVVIRLAFLGGLPGLLRYEIVNDLREKILNLKLTKRAATKDYSQSTSNQSSSSSPEACCCFFLKKPVEKILIRYEKLPSNFLISVPDAPFGARGVPLSQKISDAYLCADALVTLSKYLQQQRWIWTLQYEPNTSLQLTSASKILYTLTNIRLQEGFHFSHSAFGIIYMVQEIPVQVPKARTSEAESDFEMEENFCVVQYIMFPPHTNTTLKDSISEEDDTELTEADGELQLITECWVEPQYGISVLPSKLNYLNGLTFEEISQAIKQKDFETITVLTTFEHLCHVCQKSAELLHQSISLQDKCVSHFSADKPTISLANFENTEANEGAILSNTFTIPYCFNLLSVLPKSSQTEIVFSTLHEVRDEAKETKPNAILFDFLMENLKLVHDLDIDLSLQDSWNYLMHIHHRERDASSVSPVPFPHPNFHIADFSLKQNYSDMSKCKECKICLNHVSLDASDSSQQPLLEQQFRENLISKWKCFVKGYKPTQVVLTFIPSSYQDLEKLFLQNSNLKLHL